MNQLAMGRCFPDSSLELLRENTKAMYQSNINPIFILALLERLAAAEQVIVDAEANMGVVNPALVNCWRDLAGKPDTTL